MAGKYIGSSGITAIIFPLLLAACAQQSGLNSSADLYNAELNQAMAVISQHSDRALADPRAEGDYQAFLNMHLNYGLEIVRKGERAQDFMILTDICNRGLRRRYDFSERCSEVYQIALESGSDPILQAVPGILYQLRGEQAVRWMFHYASIDNAYFTRAFIDELALRQSGEANEDGKPRSDEIVVINRNKEKLCGYRGLSSELMKYCRENLLGLQIE